MRSLIMAERFGRENCEAEPVVVNTDRRDIVVLELDDGDRLELDAVELRAAIQPVQVVA
jgi:hypothetical protein